jgi:hypothetical protein
MCHGVDTAVRRALVATTGVHACPVACKCRREGNELGFLAKKGSREQSPPRKKKLSAAKSGTRQKASGSAAAEGRVSVHSSLQSAECTSADAVRVRTLSVSTWTNGRWKGVGAGQGMSKAGLLSSCTCHVMSPLSCSSSAARSARTEPNKNQAMSAACLASEQRRLTTLPVTIMR